MKYVLVVGCLLFAACNNSRRLTADKTIRPENISLNGKLFTALYQQRAAEYRALCLQAYNVARMQIDTYHGSGKPKALITDIDETIFDNSASAVHQAENGKEYVAADWYEWTDKAAADTMPGAAAFLRDAAAKGIEIFYITNREERERSATLHNLQQFGLPNADNDHLQMRSTTSSKEARRQNVLANHEVVLLMGDNLADLSAAFDHKTEAERKAGVDAAVAEFGHRFIVFPNPNYGDWESSIYQYNYKLTSAQKDSIILSSVHGY